MKTVYFFDMNTKRYLGEGKALQNPEYPNNPDKYHVQGNATTIKPPKTGECESAYFVKGEWKIRPYYWGKKAVHLESKIVDTVYYEGELKEGWQYVDDETSETINSDPERYTVKDGVLVRLTDEEYAKYLETKAKEQRQSEIKQELDLLDSKAVRPLRATLLGQATAEDTEHLKQYEQQAIELRAEYQSLISEE